MYGWSFAARMSDEVTALLRVMGQHRYVKEIDHRIHWSVDYALRAQPPFGEHADQFARWLGEHPQADLGSEQPELWRSASAEEIIAVLELLWAPTDQGQQLRQQLARVLREHGVSKPSHQPFTSEPEQPPHPELLLLNWELLPVEQLDAERHAGALRALDDSTAKADPSAPVLQEGPPLAEPELCDGVHNGVLPVDFVLWADGPYRYTDYVFRGVSKAAKLVDPPVGYRDVDAP